MLTDLFAKRTLTSLLSESPDWVLELLGQTTTAYTGETITPTTAMYSTAVYGCINILAETIATLPLITYERMAGGGKERAEQHPVYRLLHDEPNPEMTRVEMWKSLVGHLASWGNGYAEVVYNGAGQPIELWPLRPDYMSVMRDGSALRYDYTVNGVTYGLPAYRVLHLRGLSNNGIIGYSPIRLAREAIGLALATEEFGGRFFANNSMPGGVLTVPGKLSTTAAANLKTSWEAAHKGLDYAHRAAVLEEGVQWQQMGIPPDDAQFLETRKFQVTEIARIFRIPPHMLADLERATFSNIEHQSIEFVVHTIRPWLVAIEQRINNTLFTSADRGRFYAEHLVDGLLRGDIESRYNAYAVARNNGWMNADEIRALENMNPLPDGLGQIYLVPMNMTSAEDVAGGATLESGAPGDQAEDAPGSAPSNEPRVALERGAPRSGRANDVGSGANRRRISRAFRRLIEDAGRRILRREEADVLRQAEKLLARGNVAAFLDWLEPFYEEHSAFFAQYMLPVLLSLAEQIAEDANAEIDQDGGLTDAIEGFVGEYTDVAAATYCGSNHGQLRQIVTDFDQDGRQDEIVAGLTARIGEWQDKTPGKLAMRHTVRARNAVTREVWVEGGITRLSWVTHGENCAYCNALRGRVVGIHQTFLDKGSTFNPEGAARPLTIARHVRHAPAHDGCDCDIAPVW